MKPAVLVGVVLIVLGAVFLGYKGFTYTTTEEVLKVGPITASAQREKTVSIPPIVGWVVLGAGIVLVLVGMKKS
jgi:hypothetical protein